MNPVQKKNAEFAFSQIKNAFEKLTLPETKQYYLVLGNFSEVHLIKRDATKSVFLGRLVINNDAELRPAMQAVWDVLKKYFLEPKPVPVTPKDVTPTVVELEDFSNDKKEDAEGAPKQKRTRKSKTQVTAPVEEAPVTPVVEQIEDDGSSLDAEAEDAFEDWTDRMNQ